MAVIIQNRRDTAAAWTAANPVLADGVFGYEIDTSRLKTGDGGTPWNSLAYFGQTSPTYSPEFTFASLPNPTANQASSVFVSDQAGVPAYSDGTNWRYYSNNNVVA